MFYGICEECNSDDYVTCGNDFNFYCNECFEYEELRNTRCFSFSVIYDEHGKKITWGYSRIGFGCAERVAMWKLDDSAIPHILVVARIRKNRQNKISFGVSKPCKECIIAMHLYNIKRICYSTGKNEYGKEIFEWIDLENLSNTYSSCSKVIIKR